ncbi:hypothetical protein G3I66_30455 [Streptomyces rubrogriseus]|uniref:Uncharacterized protein n=2 Tax=Streptomyces TaxID=1883 RepID=A0A6G3TL71_9ACTN|nr:hypothetical protein [Streptomyces rubrogriseus]
MPRGPATPVSDRRDDAVRTADAVTPASTPTTLRGRARGFPIPHLGRSCLIMRHVGDTARPQSLRSGLMKRQADLTKRRAVDLCRVAAMLCRSF